MKKTFLLSFLCLFVTCMSFSQGWLKKTKAFRISSEIFPESDGGVVLFDSEFQNLIRFNAQGDSIAGKLIVGEGKICGISRCMDKGYVITYRQPKIFIIKLDLNFNKQWEKTYTMFNPISEDFEVYGLSNGNFLLPVNSAGNFGFASLNSQGNVLDSSFYGNKTYLSNITVNQEKNGLIFLKDSVLINTKSNGDTLWTKTFKKYQNFALLKLTKDYLLYSKYDSDSNLIKVSAQGSIIWQKHIRGYKFASNDNGFYSIAYPFPLNYSNQVLNRYDLGGNVQWTYPIDRKDISVNNYESLALSSHGNGTLLFGASYDTIATVIKLDGDGAQDWKYQFKLFTYSYISGMPKVTEGNGIVGGLLTFQRINTGFYSSNYLFKLDSNGRLFSRTLKGNIFHDLNKDCLKEITEKPLPDFKVRILPDDYYTLSDSLGNYTVGLDSNDHSLEIIAPNYLWSPSCTSVNSFLIPGKSGLDTLVRNFGYQGIACPLLKVDVASSNLRRCFRATHSINYANDGSIAVDNVKITAEFPLELLPLIATRSWTNNGKIYTFNIGKLEPGQKGSINIEDSVSCSASLSSSACVKVHIMPDSNCLPTSPLWDKSDIVVTSQCSNTAGFTITNQGKGDMIDSSMFRLYDNNLLVSTGYFKLAQSGKKTIAKLSYSEIYRLEADQRPFFPGMSKPRAFGSCSGKDNGIIAMSEQDNGRDQFKTSCGIIRASFDPNDKTVIPGAISGPAYVEAGQPLEYTIRFQNTGNDTALTVRVVDTLSANLDFNTFEQGASSHAVSLKTYGLNNTILEWTFSKINLPDSAINKSKSNGYVKYRIRTKDKLEEETQIKNTAAIYFDYNDPVITNTTLNVVRKNDLVLSVPSSEKTSNKIKIWPNPFAEKTQFQVSGINGELEVFLYDMMGRKVQSFITEKSEFDLSKNGLAKGIYIYQVFSAQGLLGAGKLSIE